VVRLATSPALASVISRSPSASATGDGNAVAERVCCAGSSLQSIAWAAGAVAPEACDLATGRLSMIFCERSFCTSLAVC
jgi:hypothetical protein